MEETAAAALPDDVVLEVLARVADVAALFRCSMACKRWMGMIGDRSFLRRRWPENRSHPSFLVGFFTQRRLHPGSGQDDADRDSPPVFIPAPRSVLGHGLHISSAALLQGALPLVARRGLLLVRHGPVDSRGPLRLAVCDLLAGTCEVLPPLQYDDGSMLMSYSILTREDCRSSDGQTPRSPAPVYSTFFKVLAIVVRDDNFGDVEYTLHMFSSAEPVWATPAKHAARDQVCPSLQLDAAVCHQGMAHWICYDWLSDSPTSILTADTSPEDGRACLMELSLPALQPTPKICQMAILDGALSLFCLYKEEEDLRLETWTRIDGTHWHRTRVLQLEQSGNRHIDGTLRMRSGENSGALLIMDSSPCFYIAYLETGQMEEISSQFTDMVGNVVPIEIDWPALFMSRLVRGL